MSPTIEASVHDKRLADEQHLYFTKEINLLADSGFKGYKATGARMELPQKASRLHPLNPGQKEENRQKAKARVVIEHAIGGIKIWRILKDTLRIANEEVRDLLICLAAGLHNLRIKSKLNRLIS